MDINLSLIHIYLPGAISKVNEVRERAGAQLLGTNEFTQVTGKTDMHQLSLIHI